jgi:hypothetical protein
VSLRRYAPIAPSRGTVWPSEVREHIAEHQPPCIGPLAGMPGDCSGSSEDDHVRAGHGTGLKSKSIATNGARLCGWHHRLKTEHGTIWRPRLISIIRALYRDCERCRAEDPHEEER